MLAKEKLKTWLRQFDASRTHVSIGTPVWGYKITDEELSSLQNSIKGMFEGKNTVQIFKSSHIVLKRPLVLYFSTWLQRNSTTRPRWDEVTSSVGIDYKLPKTRSYLIDCVKKGFKDLGLELHNVGADRYLDTLYCNGGLPRTAILGETNSKLMDYFNEVLDEYATFHHLYDINTIAETKLESLPETLRQPSFAILAAKLVEFLISLRDQYDLHETAVPADRLDYAYPEWRNDMPFLLIDDEAVSLIDRLLQRTSKTIRREQYPVRTKRFLFKAGEDYQLAAVVHINKTIHPDDLIRSLGGFRPPRYFQLVSLASDEKTLTTASFSYRGEPANSWQVRTRDGSFVGENARGDIGYQLWADGEYLQDGLYHKGSVLSLAEPWVFDDTGEMRFLGTGNFKSKHSSILVAYSSKPKPLNVSTTIEHIGQANQFGLLVYRVSGQVQFSTLLGDFNISTNDNGSVYRPNHEVNGKISDDVINERLNHYLGKPNLNFDSENQATENDFYWVSKQGEEHPFYENTQVFGQGTIIHKVDGEVLWSHECIILSSDFAVEIIPNGNNEFEIKIQGIKGTEIGLTPGQEISLLEEPSTMAGFVFLDFLTRNLQVEMVSLTVKDTNTDFTIQIPFKIEAISFVHKDGKPYRKVDEGRLTISELSKLYLKTKGLRESVALSVRMVNIAAENSPPLIQVSEHNYIDKEESAGKLSGRNIANLLNRVIRQSNSSHDYIELNFYAGSNKVDTSLSRVYRYKLQAKINLSDTGSYLTVRKHTYIKPPDLYMKPTWDLKADPVKLEQIDLGSSDPEIVYQIPDTTEYGSWIAWSPSSRDFRPVIIRFEIPITRQSNESLGAIGQSFKEAFQYNEDFQDFDEHLKKDSLEYALKYLERSEEHSGFDYSHVDAALERMSKSMSHKSWGYFDSAIDFLNEIEATSLPAFKRLSRNPRCLVMLLLKSKTEDSFQRVWRLTDELAFEWYTVPVSDWVYAINKNYNFMISSFKEISDLPEKLINEISTRTLKLLANKGAYFNSLSKLALQKLEIREVWSSDASVNTLGKEFLQSRHEMFSRHPNDLLVYSQTRGADEFLIKKINEMWPVDNLPSELRGLFPRPNGDEHWLRRKGRQLTAEFPVQLALYNWGLFDSAPSFKINRSINFLVSQLHAFDKAWLDEAMALTIQSVNSCFYDAELVVEPLEVKSNNE